MASSSDLLLEAGPDDDIVMADVVVPALDPDCRYEYHLLVVVSDHNRDFSWRACWTLHSIYPWGLVYRHHLLPPLPMTMMSNAWMGP